ncbi:MAG: CDP-diacylglycerol--serine O-phosphatidyltransferase [Muribaculaceae bacterium]|nr:CDP-diacylglycerol--serine O-phosphatidyltransferase [Muribaculaceae bacterium]
MIRRIINCIPNTITLLNLLSGCVAIIFAFRHNEMFGALTGLEWAYIMIGAAALFDFCDGASARALHAYSPLGAELDSLSDLVSFGVAPAMMVLNLMLDHSAHTALCYAALFIPMMGALRLARFNIDTTQSTTFRGLPIPANAIFWIGMCGWIERYGYPGTGVMVVLIALVSLSMVCGLRMFSLKFKTFGLRDNFVRYVIILAAVVFVATCRVSGLAWTIVLYLLLSMLSRSSKSE